MDSFWGTLSGRVSSEVSSDVCLGEGSQIQGWLSGKVSSEVSSDVCMGECTHNCWIRFGGSRFLQCNDTKSFLSCLLPLCFISRPCDVIDAKNEVHGVIKDSLQRQDGIQPTVHVSSILSNKSLFLYIYIIIYIYI